jgi:hypothetical protein
MLAATVLLPPQSCCASWDSCCCVESACCQSCSHVMGRGVYWDSKACVRCRIEACSCDSTRAVGLSALQHQQQKQVQKQGDDKTLVQPLGNCKTHM